jgi:hypothetical protein
MVNSTQQSHSVDFASDINKDGSILGFENHGGGGHKQAMKAARWQFEQQQGVHEHAKDLKGRFKTVDVVGGSFPPIIDRLMKYLMTYQWNKAKKSGDIKAQNNLINGKIMGIAKPIIADILFFIPVFVATVFRLAFDRNITRIIDTQPLATSAIIKAARLVNFLFGRSIRVTKILTDLPTEGATHFSRPLKRLSKKDKAIFDVITTKPLILDQNESEKDWWKRVFGLDYNAENQDLSQVKYREFPLRPAFLKWKDTPVEVRQDHLNVKVNNEEEFQFINELLGNSLEKKQVPFGSDPSKMKDVISVPMDPAKDVVGMVTIGSQAAAKTKDYVKNFIDVSRQLPNDRQYILYTGCGRHTKGENTLFKEVYELVKAEKLPDHIKVIPLGFQDDDEFAPMMHHMTFGVAGTGGLTTMEMLRTAKGKIFIHSEAELSKIKKEKPNDLINVSPVSLGATASAIEVSSVSSAPNASVPATSASAPNASVPNEEFAEIVKCPKQRKLLEGFGVWEKWNGVYQVKEKQAEIVAPGAVFTDSLLDLYRKNGRDIKTLKRPRTTQTSCKEEVLRKKIKLELPSIVAVTV